MYIIIEKPIGGNFSRTIDDKRLANRHDRVPQNDKDVGFVNESIKSGSSHEKACSYKKTYPKAFGVNYVIGWEIHDWVY